MYLADPVMQLLSVTNIIRSGAGNQVVCDKKFSENYQRSDHIDLCTGLSSSIITEAFFGKGMLLIVRMLIR
jgi:hypothetical protein